MIFTAIDLTNVHYKTVFIVKFFKKGKMHLLLVGRVYLHGREENQLYK